MYPELFRIGGFAVSSYGVMMALAFVVGGFTLRWQLKKRGVRARLRLGHGDQGPSSAESWEPRSTI